jgi:MOSC domain-containing protein YiiM
LNTDVKTHEKFSGGKVASLTRYAKKCEAGEMIQNAVLAADAGMEGDFHAQGGGQQISLLTVEARRWMNAQAVPGLCFRRYKENILFESLPASFLKAGTRLRTGEAIIEISDEGKHCFEECSLFNRGEPCVLAGQNLFAQVIKSGVVRVGDSVETMQSGDA